MSSTTPGRPKPPSTDAFYAELSQGYEATIRQLVPGYDDMTAWVLDLLAAAKPVSILDMGCGNARLSAHVLERVPGARVVGVEASAAMVQEAGPLVEDLAGRLRLVNRDLLDFQPDEACDAAYSNLVLHNIPAPRKQALLGRLLGWLRPGGVFIWGDMVRHPDPAVEARMVAYRERFAREHGCPEPLARENFRKEKDDDHPLTIAATVAALEEAGFRGVAPVWARDTFAVVHARRPA